MKSLIKLNNEVMNNNRPPAPKSRKWLMRNNKSSLSGLISNYSVLMSTWDEGTEVVKDTESKARIQGIRAQMKTFNFLFGSVLGEMVLRHTDNLSRTLQDKALSAAEGQKVADMVVRTLQTLRNVESFDLFWLKVTKSGESLDVGEPQLPRQRKAPRRYDDGSAHGDFHADPKAYYRQHYFEAIDLVVNCITDRFQQPGYNVYRNLEQLLLKACQKEDITSEFDYVCLFYKDDFQPELLRAQLLTFGIDFQRIQREIYGDSDRKPIIFDIKEYFISLTTAQKSLLSSLSCH